MVLRGRALHALRVVAIAASVVGFNGARPATHPRHASSPALPARSSAPLCAATAPPSASPPPDEISADAPLSVLVAGCGVGGALLAKTLTDAGAHVTILERTSEFRRFGGPIQLASNALSTLQAIDPSLFERLMERFTFTGVRENGIKDGVRDEWYCKFDAITTLPPELDLAYTGVINRPDLQELLLDDLEGTSAKIETGCSVKSFEQRPGGGVRVTTEDGRAFEADALVGADGIWSNVRSQLWEQPARGEGSGCTYSGYTVFAGESTYQTSDYFETGYKVFVGPRQYFVISDVGKGRIQWYAFLGLPPGSKARASNKEYLGGLFEGWSPAIHEALAKTTDDAIEQRDLYDRPPSVLKPWSRGCVTLLGDACHPMMPNLGQGGCQAMEDAYVLTNLLSELKSRKQIPRALSSYYYQRLPRTAAVQGLSRIASDFIINFFDTPARLVWGEGGLPKVEYPGLISFLVALWRPLLPLVFEVQFRYLYSFAPTTLKERGLELSQITREERKRAKADAEAAWDEAKQGGQESVQRASFLAK